MIETIMIFAFGFLLASLVALLMLPAVNARAIRLARRRMEALFPLSTAEIAAEKDYLRAQFAVERRRLERRMEMVGTGKHADMAAIGARTLEAAALARTVSEREAMLAVKEGEIAAVRGERDRVAGDLEASRADLAVGIETLQVLEGAHRDLLDNLIESRRDRAYDSFPPPAAEALPAPDRDPARIAALEAEREDLRASLAAAQEALAKADAETARENAALRDAIAAVAESLVRGEKLPSVAAFPLAKR